MNLLSACVSSTPIITPIADHGTQSYGEKTVKFEIFIALTFRKQVFLKDTL